MSSPETPSSSDNHLLALFARAWAALPWTNKPSPDQEEGVVVKKIVIREADLDPRTPHRVDLQAVLRQSQSAPTPSAGERVVNVDAFVNHFNYQVDAGKEPLYRDAMRQVYSDLHELGISLDRFTFPPLFVGEGKKIGGFEAVGGTVVYPSLSLDVHDLDAHLNGRKDAPARIRIHSGGIPQGILVHPRFSKGPRQLPALTEILLHETLHMLLPSMVNQLWLEGMVYGACHLRYPELELQHSEQLGLHRLPWNSDNMVEFFTLDQHPQGERSYRSETRFLQSKISGLVWAQYFRDHPHFLAAFMEAADVNPAAGHPCQHTEASLINLAEAAQSGFAEWYRSQPVFQRPTAGTQITRDGVQKYEEAGGHFLHYAGEWANTTRASKLEDGLIIEVMEVRPSQNFRFELRITEDSEPKVSVIEARDGKVFKDGESWSTVSPKGITYVGFLGDTTLIEVKQGEVWVRVEGLGVNAGL